MQRPVTHSLLSYARNVVSRCQRTTGRHSLEYFVCSKGTEAKSCSPETVDSRESDVQTESNQSISIFHEDISCCELIIKIQI